MPSQILITGATGFIGRRLTRDLINRGGNVRILARSPRKARELFGDHAEAVVGDVGDPRTVSKACRGIEVVYHIAGIYRFGLRQSSCSMAHQRRGDGKPPALRIRGPS